MRFDVVGPTREPLGYGRGFCRERVVPGGGFAWMLPLSFTPLPVCVNSEFGTPLALRLLTRMPSGIVWPLVLKLVL